MKNNVLRIICLALAVLVAIPAAAGCASSGKSNFSLPTRTLASEEIKYFGSFGYQVYDDGSVVIVEYSGSETKINVPENIDGGRVIEIGDTVFADNTSLQSVRLSSVEIIGDFAFYGCAALSDVSFGKKLWSVGMSAFDKTPWLSAHTEEFVTVGDGVLVKYQGDATYVVLPDNIRHISNAFEMNENIIGVELGDSVLTLGLNAFALCTGLRYVKFGQNLKLIGAGAFDSCENLTSVIIPDSVERIDEYAFNYCSNMSMVKIGSSVKSVGAYAFNSCICVKVVDMPATVETIGTYAFAECLSLTMVFYGGSAEQFEALELDSTNYLMKDVEKIYAQ